MKVLRAFKIRCYPTAAQRRQFAQAEGACRYVRNRVLREMGESYEASKRGEGERKTVVAMSREVTQWKRQAETAWLADIPSVPLSQELRDLDAAFRNFFAGRAKYPKKKRKQFGCSIRFAPTSKSCSACGHRLEELRLSVREWDCSACGAHHDRDVNAAKNILKFAIAGGTGEGGATPDARGGLNTRRKAGQPDLPTEPVEARTECGHAASRTNRRVA